jgi:ParB family chromosome partitioning protein
LKKIFYTDSTEETAEETDSVILSNNTENFPVELIVEGDNVRENYNPEELKELAKSIESDGQLQAIGIQKISKDKYDLVYGFRRFKAIKYILKRKTIKVNLLTSLPKERGIIQLIENIQRTDLNDFEIAKSLSHLKKKTNSTNASLASKLNKSEKWINEKITHYNIVADTTSYLPEVTKLTTSQVMETRSLPEIKRNEVLKKALQEDLTVKQIRAAKNKEKSNTAGTLTNTIINKKMKKLGNGILTILLDLEDKSKELQKLAKEIAKSKDQKAKQNMEKEINSIIKNAEKKINNSQKLLKSLSSL